MQTNVIQINPNDNVAVAIREIRSGESLAGVAGLQVKACKDVPRNHKVALREISENEAVIKYGEAIGLASVPIRAGDWVHTHNLKSKEDAPDGL